MAWKWDGAYTAGSPSKLWLATMQYGWFMICCAGSLDQAGKVLGRVDGADAFALTKLVDTHKDRVAAVTAVPEAEAEAGGAHFVGEWGVPGGHV
jgi:hypothetical protein